MKINPKHYWESKILDWESARYSNWAAAHPFAWTVRSRFFKAAQVISDRLPKGSSVFEIGCGSGLLAERLVSQIASYKGIDIAENAIQLARKRVYNPNFEFNAADLLNFEYSAADLTVMLGVIDWLDADGVELLMRKVKSKYVLISHTQTSSWNPYLIYRRIFDGIHTKGTYCARSYSAQQVEAILIKNNYSFEAVTHPTLFNPGALIWGVRNS